MVGGRILLLAIVLAWSLPVPAQAQRWANSLPAPHWGTYVNRESDTRLDFPYGIFEVDTGKLEKGRGKRFLTSDGRAELDVYSIDNDRGETPRGYVARRLMVDPRSLAYKRITGRFFVVSGVHQGRIFYSRCNFSSRRGSMHCILMAYPRREKKAWDGVVTRISRSLRGA